MPYIKTAIIGFMNKLRPNSEFSKRQAEALQREKMAFLEMLASAINHEIANPLSIARGQCEAFVLSWKEGLYKDKPPYELLEKSILVMERVIKETDRISDITKRLTDFVRSGKTEKPQKIDITGEIEEALTFLNAEIKLSDIRIKKDIPASLPPTIADKKHIQQIFFNVIKNAVQSLKENRTIEITGRLENSHIMFEVRDTGCGIKEEDMKKIFTPFFTTKTDGTGLGLFIVKQLTKTNKGRIEIKSKPGEGTSVILYFPAA
ncbi:MAG: ATP-binding protein [Candidatus Omnitrophica bacterium]|nr:ATP-binding protein [Candidatus Omnitrophota bacterium]